MRAALSLKRTPFPFFKKRPAPFTEASSISSATAVPFSMGGGEIPPSPPSPWLRP
uniref:Uncharacterized protein n=1 Tax=Physcomitrium patens TaxID=3218 RepID=A0A2K1ILU3_PHYPA|nr:hypothetical protein PHYPA_026554 [Physcomitrium patens]